MVQQNTIKTAECSMWHPIRLAIGLLFFFVGVCVALPPDEASLDKPHVIEELTFELPSEGREEFLRLDREIWTEALSQQPGFLWKESWIPNDAENQVKLVIHWRSQADWDAVPQALIAATGRKFGIAMREVSKYKLVGSRSYQRHTHTRPDHALSRKVDHNPSPFSLIEEGPGEE
jgi:uncharacterized protein (TIGR03792 family)